MALKIVRTDGSAGADMTMAEAIMNIAKKAIGAEALCACLIVETATGTMQIWTVPDAASVRKGMIDMAWDVTNPGTE